MPKCSKCDRAAVIRQSFTSALLCSQCFINSFEEGVHKTIQENHLILPGQVIVAGVSGGKDSSVLLAVLYRIIYERWPELYKGCELKMCAVDEGIVGYRKESLDVVYAL